MFLRLTPGRIRVHGTGRKGSRRSAAGFTIGTGPGERQAPAAAADMGFGPLRVNHHPR
jgi:hypothetical protein